MVWKYRQELCTQDVEVGSIKAGLLKERERKLTVVSLGSLSVWSFSDSLD